MPPQKSLLRVVAEPLVIAVVLAFGVRSSVRLFSIPSESMTPTLEIGDHIVVTPYRFAKPQHGDVVVFRRPSDERELMVKRIIGLPGDLIDSRGGRVRISGRTIQEFYVRRQAESGTIRTQIVPEDCFFVMGDNRENSYDSRQWGPLARQLLVGRARLVLWSSSDSMYDAPVRASTVTTPGRGISHVRLNRVFKWIE